MTYKAMIIITKGTKGMNGALPRNLVILFLCLELGWCLRLQHSYFSL